MSFNNDAALQRLANRLVRDKTHEGWAIANEKLLLQRWGGRGGDVGVFSAPSLHAVGGELWYRTMLKAEFDILFKEGRLAPPGYGGITNSREYAEGYLTVSRKATAEEDAKRGTHTVEFFVVSPIDLRHELKYVGLEEKAEAGAMSFGLGPAQKNGVGAEYFNTLLSSKMAKWRLVGLLADV